MPVIIGKGGSGKNIGRSIKNAERRLRSVGVSPIPDNRNWFEKATNLPKNQNWFFDILDLIGRPLNATNTALDDAISGRNVSLGDSLYRGFSGRTRTPGSKIARDFGIDDPTAQFWAGLGWDVFTDPTNLIPGKAIASATGAVGKGIKSGAKATLNLMPDVVKTKIDDALAGVNRVFGGRYAGMDPRLAKMLQDTNNQIDYLRQGSFEEIVGAMKGLPNAGVDIGRVMEAPLKITKDPKELLQKLFQREPFQLRMTGKELDDFMRELNINIQKAPEVAGYLSKKSMQRDDIVKRINDLFKEEPYLARYAQMRAQGHQFSSPRIEKLLDQLDRLNRAKKAVKTDIKTTKGGIKFKPIQGAGKGVQAFNPHPRIFKKAVGDFDEFINKISPMKSFDNIAQAANSRQVAEELLREGKVTLKKGDPVIDDLTRIFGKDVTVRTRNNVTIRLKPDSQYHGENIDALQFTDRLGPINIARPQRELSQDPRVQARASRFNEMNDSIRALAAQNGISVNEIDGYMTHILSEAEKANRASVVDSGLARYGGNKAVVKERKYEGSAEDVNEMLGREFFNPDAYYATAIGQKRVIEYILAEGFKRKVLSDPNFARPYKGGPVPKDHVVIRPDQYNFFRTDDGSVGVTKGKQYVVHKDVQRALENFKGRIQDESVSAFTKAYDTVLGLWKKLTLFSPTYHIRNILGANWNMYIAGMNVPDLVKYISQAASDLRKPYDETVDAFKRQGLHGSSFAYAEFKYGGAESEEALRRALARQQMSPGQRALDFTKNIFNENVELAHRMDVLNRYAMFKWALDKGMSVEEAAKKVKEVLFDYQDLSEVERKVFRRLIPFYTFMRKNAAFQIKHFLENPLRYKGIEKIRDNRDETYDRQDVIPEWLDQALAIPLFGDKSDVMFANINPPAADLAKIADSPLAHVASSLTPALKLPLELNANYDTFMMKPIEKYPGETKDFLGLDMSAKTAHSLNQVGLLRNLDRLFKSEQPAVDGLFPGLFRNHNVRKAKESKDYDRLKELEAEIQRLKAQGVSVPTIRELQKRR